MNFAMGMGGDPHPVHGPEITTCIATAPNSRRTWLTEFGKPFDFTTFGHRCSKGLGTQYHLLLVAGERLLKIIPRGRLQTGGLR